MAALYSQGLAWEQMHHLVREYARQMSSVQHLLWDLTLPIMSIFNGVGFDRVVRETFKHGAQQIEDLWLRFAPPFLQCNESVVRISLQVLPPGMGGGCFPGRSNSATCMNLKHALGFEAQIVKHR